MKPFLLLAFFSLWGCGDLLDGIRIGTDETSAGSATEEPPFLAVYRSADFSRFPGDRDSIVASASVGEHSELVVPSSPTRLLLSLWSRDSSVGAWVRDPGTRFPQTFNTKVVSIDLTDSVTHKTFELSVAGTGIASTGTRIDSARTRHRVRSPGGKVSLAVRWSVGSSWRIVHIDSVSLDRDQNLELSGLLESSSGSRVVVDSSGRFAKGAVGT